MSRFDSQSIKRIVAVVKQVERDNDNVRPNKRFSHLGGSMSALFRLDADIPARFGSTLGKAELTKVNIIDGEIEDGDTFDVYNVTDKEIFSPTGASGLEECDTAQTDEELYLVANLISGHWICVNVLYGLEDLNVGIALALETDSLDLRLKTIMVKSSDCGVSSIDRESCDE